MEKEFRKDKASRSFIFEAVKDSSHNRLDNRSEAVSAIRPFIAILTLAYSLLTIHNEGKR